MKNNEVISVASDNKSVVAKVSEQFKYMPLASLLPQMSIVSELKKYAGVLEKRLEFIQNDNNQPAEKGTATEKSMLEQALGWLELQSDE